MTARFWVPGPLPGMNEIIDAAKGFGGRGVGYSKLKKEWTEKVCWHAKAAHVPKFERVRLEFLWIEPVRSNGAERDPDNVEAGQKFIWDGLKLAKVIPDDKRKQNAGTKHDHEKGALAGVEVTIIDATEPARSLTPIVNRRLAPLVDGRYRGETPEE
jgi:hypothetical protein